jgi:endonuclease/exonuclease/phosphatase family metal-dependent hydrolase
MAFYQSIKNSYRYPRGDAQPGQSGWIADRLLRLRALLNAEIVSRRAPNSLIIGSWNIRHFDGGRPRLPESFHYIAEIIDHFDICALQEVKSVESMEQLMGLLGPNWDYFINDSSGAGRGNHERMAFVYSRNRVFFRNLIGELVIEKGALPGDEQIGRTPFFASFQAGWFRFVLCSAHIVFEETEGRPLREDEIRVIAEILKDRAKDTDEVHVFIGDMNIEEPGDPGHRALTSNGFEVPDLGPTSLTGTKHYDQIAFSGLQDKTEMLNRGVIHWQEAVFTDAEMEAYRDIAKAIRRRRKSGEGFWDFHTSIQRALAAGEDVGEAYSDWEGEYSSWRTHEMSDHLPIWIELKVDYSNEYLLGIKALG